MKKIKIIHILIVIFFIIFVLFLRKLSVEFGSGLLTGDLKDGYLSEMMGIMEGYEEYYSEI